LVARNLLTFGIFGSCASVVERMLDLVRQARQRVILRD
jgi:hypothetical protein